MAKIIKKWDVPVKGIDKWGFTCYHVRVGVVGLWLRWFWVGIWDDKLPTWKKFKQLAKEGELVTQRWFVLCPHPLHTNFYYFK